MTRSRRLVSRALLVVALGLVPRAAAAASPAGHPVAPPDPLVALLHRMDTFLHSAELDGITRDPRYALHPAEFTRLSVVCQLLGYLELERSIPETRTHAADITERADFLLARFDEVRSGGASDGMLAYALLGAWEATGDARYLEKGNFLVAEAKERIGWAATLNWGLMSGMALARAHRQSGDPVALERLDDIVASLDSYRGADGSYPHLCLRSPDVHYTGWMTMELIAIARELDDPARMEQALRAVPFLAARVGPGGETQYVGPCPACPGAIAVYFSLGSGCFNDYDTRAWTNELGYLALAFDETRDARYAEVMAFLAALEDHGAFPDKWAYFPAASDPIHPWGSASRSVIRTSILFWTLATIRTGRAHPAASGAMRPTADASVPAPIAGAAPPAPALAWDAPAGALRFTLAGPAGIRLAIHDVRGRCVRRLLDEPSSGAGARTVAWDRRDEQGRPVPPGVYFAHLVAGARRETARIPLAR